MKRSTLPPTLLAMLAALALPPAASIASDRVAALLSVRVSGDGVGSVTSDSAGIECMGPCSIRLATDTSVARTTITLTATAGSTGSVFTGWSGACAGTAPTCTVATDATTSVEAVFADIGGGVQAVAAGYLHTCALSSAAVAWCWGYNNYGQLGDGTTTQRLVPVPVSGLPGSVQAISAGYLHTCALTSAGAVWCWGYNNYGQLGDGTTTQRLIPVPVSGLSAGIQAIGAGENHNCALTNSGAAWCWGYNLDGQIGDGTTTDRLTPTTVSGLSSGVQKLATGGWHTCALNEAGAPLCWGSNTYGQLGDGTTTRRLTPAAVSGLSGGIRSISGGIYHTCGLTNMGAALCWGYNLWGQLGDGTTTSRRTPVAVSGMSSDVQAIQAGAAGSTCALVNGGAWCWGFNSYGNIGDGSSTNRLAPVAVSGLSSGMQAISPGYYHSCGSTTAGAMWCWGRNDRGQIGDGSTTNRPIPVLVIEQRPNLIFRSGFD